MLTRCFLWKALQGGRTVFQAIVNLCLFILFVLSVLAIIGMQLLGGQFPLDFEPPRRNFENFGRAWLLCFQTLTGDDWSNQMYVYMNDKVTSAPTVAFLFFLMTFIFTNYIVMNFFIAVILENFSMQEDEKKAEQKRLLRDEWREEIERLIHEDMRKGVLGSQRGSADRGFKGGF
jgi:hypothetical protein